MPSASSSTFLRWSYWFKIVSLMDWPETTTRDRLHDESPETMTVYIQISNFDCVMSRKPERTWFLNRFRLAAALKAWLNESYKSRARWIWFWFILHRFSILSNGRLTWVKIPVLLICTTSSSSFLLCLPWVRTCRGPKGFYFYTIDIHHILLELPLL